MSKYKNLPKSPETGYTTWKTKDEQHKPPKTGVIAGSKEQKTYILLPASVVLCKFGDTPRKEDKIGVTTIGTYPSS